MTDAEFDAWLERDDAQRVVLVELDHVYDAVAAGVHTPTTATRYFSDRGYVTGPADTPASTAYADVISALPEYRRSIDHATLGGRGTLSVGTLRLKNADGELDDLLALACDGSEVRVYLGDARWPRADFRSMFTAVTERIDAPDDMTELQVSLRDSLGLLNASMATTFIGGTGPNKERARPVNLGLCHQVECLLEDATVGGGLYRYGVEGSVVAGSVREAGFATPFTDNGDGTFTLTSAPGNGIITCDVLTLGPGSTYVASDLIAKLIDDYTALDMGTQFAGSLTPDVYPGPPSTAFGDGDFQLGVRVAEKTNVLDVLDQIAYSAICFFTFTRDARFGYGRIWPYVAQLLTPEMTFTADDVRRDDVRLSHANPTYYSWYFYYNKNWLVMSQGQLAGGATPEDVARFSAKGVYASNRPSRPGIEAVISPAYYDEPSPYHKTMAVSPETETLLSILDADEDPDYPLGTRWFRRMRNINFPWLEFIPLTVGLRAYRLELGAVAAFQLDRFDFDSGVQGQVVDIDLRLVDGEVDLVLVRQRGADVLPPNVSAGVGTIEGAATVTGVGTALAVWGVGSAAGAATVSGVGEAVLDGGGGASPEILWRAGNSYDPWRISGPEMILYFDVDLHGNHGTATTADVDVFITIDSSGPASDFATNPPVAFPVSSDIADGFYVTFDASAHGGDMSWTSGQITIEVEGDPSNLIVFNSDDLVLRGEILDGFQADAIYSYQDAYFGLADYPLGYSLDGLNTTNPSVKLGAWLRGSSQYFPVVSLVWSCSAPGMGTVTLTDNGDGTALVEFDATAVSSNQVASIGLQYSDAGTQFAPYGTPTGVQTTYLTIAATGP